MKNLSFVSAVAIATTLGGSLLVKADPTINTPPSLVACAKNQVGFTGTTGQVLVRVVPGTDVSTTTPLDQLTADSSQGFVTYTPKVAAGTVVTFIINDDSGKSQFSGQVPVVAGPNKCSDDSGSTGDSASSSAASAPAATGSGSPTKSGAGSASGTGSAAPAAATTGAISSAPSHGGAASSAAPSSPTGGSSSGSPSSPKPATSGSAGSSGATSGGSTHSAGTILSPFVASTTMAAAAAVAFGFFGGLALW
ncbi:uncharacterized protein PFL1_00982 [Pseudozyma flocculosa PF-1]|uniref:Uncharacterized protein n=1 Tax=Pseudozyma flocculosa TaxID=84751 RepID=A0A5C3F8H3_9BASI|nr:uncharacterized protein PFL1_00982 [Pseudozyma flocculosa PF-1]EPQ31649.1 hypothetical protein PFL1_00982 [Pseudozyma flocculosa PF-1]SPO40763.1 uncharacterized protein PSFLO_06245 [Pseudozyma flocculosa]